MAAGFTTIDILDGEGNTKSLQAFQDASGHLVLLPHPPIAEVLDEDDASAGVVTFTENLYFITLNNLDPNNDGVFTVNGIAIPVPAADGAAKSTWSDWVGGTAGKTVSVSGATSYTIYRHG